MRWVHYLTHFSNVGKASGLILGKLMVGGLARFATLNGVIYFSFLEELKNMLRLCIVNVGLWNDLRQHKEEKGGRLNSPNKLVKEEL